MSECVEWGIYENGRSNWWAESSARTIGQTYRSRVLQMRSERRKQRVERRMYEIYDRLSSLPDATRLVTRDLFYVYRIPEDVREEYVRTHKVVGPGALATYDYAVIFSGFDGLCGPTDYTVRANGDVIYPLALVLTYPDTLRGKLSAAQVLQLRRRAAINPNSAAVEAQNYMRRRTKGKEVVVVGELNRSVRACCKTIERFSVHMDAYDEPIESLVEGNWIQMFGPNGIRDWSVSAPIVRANTLRCLYRMIVVMGGDVVRLLFENELAIMGVVLVDYGDMCSEPLRGWTPCAASDCASSSYEEIGVAIPSPELSDELLAVGERETIDVLPSNLRSAFESRKAGVISVRSRKGNHLGNAVDLGGNVLLTCAHVAEAAVPYSTNELSVRGISDHLHMLDGGGLCNTNCPVREPVVGELGVFIFVVDDEIRYSSPTVVLRIEDGHVITSVNPIMGKGRSGCALVSLTDMCLLGIFTARLNDLLVSVVVNPNIKAQVYFVARGISLHRGDGLYEAALLRTREAVKDCFIGGGGICGVSHPSGLVDCAADSVCRFVDMHVQSRPAATATFRDPIGDAELCRVVGMLGETFVASEVHTVGYIDNGGPLRFDDCNVDKDVWVLLVAELDSSVIGFRLLHHVGLCVSFDTRLVMPRGRYNDVFSGQDQSSLSNLLGDNTMDEIKEELLTALTGGLRSPPRMCGKDDSDCSIVEFVSHLTSAETGLVCGLFDYEFYLELIGERAIRTTFIGSRHGCFNALEATNRIFIYLILRFISFRLGTEVYDCVLTHIGMVTKPEPP